MIRPKPEDIGRLVVYRLGSGRTVTVMLSSFNRRWAYVKLKPGQLAREVEFRDLTWADGGGRPGIPDEGEWTTCERGHRIFKCLANQKPGDYVNPRDFVRPDGTQPTSGTPHVPCICGAHYAAWRRGATINGTVFHVEGRGWGYPREELDFRSVENVELP